MSSQFNISVSIRNAYLFVGRERHYLFRAALLPAGALVITNVLVFLQRRDFSEFEEFLWNVPATVLAGWFMFVEARLLLLGERLDRLPSDRDFLLNRRRLQATSIIIWLLFNMWWTTFWGYLRWAVEGQMDGGQKLQQGPESTGVMFFGLFLLGMSIWVVRFGVAHILAAVDYPIKRYIFRVNGIGISLRLIGMSFVCMVPVSLVVMVLDAYMMPQKGDPTDSDALTFIVVVSLLWILTLALLTAAAGFALRQILGRPREETTP